MAFLSALPMKKDLSFCQVNVECIHSVITQPLFCFFAGMKLYPVLHKDLHLTALNTVLSSSQYCLVNDQNNFKYLCVHSNTLFKEVEVADTKVGKCTPYHNLFLFTLCTADHLYLSFWVANIS